MKRWVVLTVFSAVAVGLGGCVGSGATAAQGTRVGSAVGRAAGAVIGHQIGETGIGGSIGSDLGGVAGSIAGSSGHPRQVPAQAQTQERDAKAKFCPVGGERYPETYRYCPVHGAELRSVAQGQ